MGIIKKEVAKDLKAQAEELKKEKEQYGDSKYEQAFKKYNMNVDDDEVREAVKKIIAEKMPRTILSMSRSSSLAA